MNKLLTLLLSLVCLLPTAGKAISHDDGDMTISLGGLWQAALQNDGSRHEVSLPGSLLTNNLGDELSVDTKWTGSLYDSSFYFNPYMEQYRHKGRMKFPFFLTPNKHYVGDVVYTRKVFVPKEWKDKTITLFLERPHIETTVFVNGQVAGHQMSLNTPHVYDVSKYIVAGTDNEIAIKVYNGIENVCVGQDSHSVTDQTQGNWNGIAGKMELRAENTVRILSVLTFPDIDSKSVRVKTTIYSPKKCSGMLTYFIGAPTQPSKPLSISPRKGRGAPYTTVVEDVIPMGDDMKLWDEFSPNLYTLKVSFVKGKKELARKETTFGMRKINISGMQFYLNDKPIWIRGTVENCDFPLTGFPPTDVDSWKKIFVKCKQYGLNTMRFHSYCPPEAAFIAADEVGFYLAPEGPSWPNHGVKMNKGMFIDQYIMDETRRMVAAYGNHPSFVMMSAGNEPAGDWVTWGNRWVEYWKQADPRRVYASFNVGGGWAWDDGSQYHVKGGARGLDWDRHAPQSTDDFYSQLLFPRNYKDTVPNNSPIIAHEQGQWCAFPDFDERSQYKGVYKAYNFDIFADLLKKNGMGSMAKKFLYSSGKLQTLCYKYEIERNLRTKDYAGFVILGLNDYSGQGTALVGPLNVFWREKGYVDSTGWRQFCSPVVVMAEFPKFTFSSGEECHINIDIYNALEGKSLNDAELSYTITPCSRVMCRPVALHCKAGKNLHIAKIPLYTQTDKPCKYTLTLQLKANDKTYNNTYDYWVYPDCTPPIKSSQIYETDTLDAKAIKVLEKGGKVLITASGKVRFGNDVKQHYLPVFWNTSWFKMRPPHTTGAYIDTGHPLFKEFPTDDWSNLNWWELLNKAQVMNLSELPASYQPPIQPIDTWHVSRKLGMLIEANVLKGKLLMTTMDITNNLDKRIVARQMRKAVIDYMLGNDFNPSLTLDTNIISNFFIETAPPVNMYTNESPDELKPKLK